MAEVNPKLAILVGIAERSSEVAECERSLDELERLLNTAGGECYAKVLQIKDSFDPRTCIGSGKVAEIKEMCDAAGVDLVIFDFELTPAQIRNLENDMGGAASVIDRSMLILDIFALHAVSGEGKLQVELAQLKYSAPRIMGKGTELSRQGGGIGSRGPGESKLETDRRHMRERIYTLEHRLEEMEHNRSVMRAQRDRSGLTKVALVGYTNAGKSTLLNRLTDAGVLSEDKLFATLDPTTRKLVLPSGESILLTDTVGFIRKLPHHLVKAFKSTLDEASLSDILMIVVDASDAEYRHHISVTAKTLTELGADGKPTVYVFNKCDNLAEELPMLPPDASAYNIVYISARTGEGMDKLLETLEKIIHDGKRTTVFNIPNSKAGLISTLYSLATVSDVQYGYEYITVVAICDDKVRGMLRDYVTEVQ